MADGDGLIVDFERTARELGDSGFYGLMTAIERLDGS
jgi:hypothetical protein